MNVSREQNVTSQNTPNLTLCDIYVLRSDKSESFEATSGQPVLRTECLGGRSSPPDQQKQSPFHAKVKVDC